MSTKVLFRFSCVVLVRLLLVPVLVGSVATATAQQTAPPPLLTENSPTLAADLEALIPDLMTKGHVPGLSIAVIRNGKIVWDGAFGVKNTETKTKVTKETIFEAASLTKPFFAYVVLQLVAEGTLELDTPLVNYVPEAEIVERVTTHSLDHPDFRRDWFEKITTRHVLSHTAGTPHGEAYDPCYPLLFEPGSKNKYSAAGYYYLQVVVEHLKGVPVEEIAQQYALEPLGMSHSSLVWRDTYEQTVANGHNLPGDPQAFRKYTTAHAAASMYTTATDYARFVCAMLNDERLSREEIALMLSDQIEIDDHISWSLGFGLQRDENGNAFWQWGDYGIFRNFVIAYKKQKTGVVYLANSFHGLGIGRDLVRHSVGGESYALEFLGYHQYDSSFARFTWLALDIGAEAAIARLPEFRAADPEFMDEGTINGVGYALLNAERVDDAIAFFELNTREHPTSANVWDSLGEAYMTAGELEKAIAQYEHALSLDETNTNAKKRIVWMRLAIEARDNPITIPADELKKFVGTYGPRRVTLEDGQLRYIREGSGSPERTLHPLTAEIFALEEVPYFRFRFVEDENSVVIAIEGLMVNGVVDRHEREASE